MSSTYQKFYSLVDEQQKTFINHLAEWVAINDVSTNLSCRDKVLEMVQIAKKEYEELGAKMWTVENPKGMQIGPNGEEVPYPPILLGQYPPKLDEKKKTILIYGHLDVQPALKSDGWDTDPWVLTEVDGKLYGRGSTDDKGPVLGWLLAMQSLKKLDMDLPVNIKFCLEAMEESNSEGLEEVINDTCPDFFRNDVDGTVISDNYWLGTSKPCLTYGLRGIGCWSIEVECAKQDLHSGVYGGTIHEAMTDLISLMGTLVENTGKIKIEGIYDHIDPVTEEEEAIYRAIDFDVKAYADSIRGNLMHPTKEITLQHRWRQPSLSLHGIEGAFYEPGEKTVIPRKVIGKFSIRIVPSLTGSIVAKLVADHFEKEIKKLNTPNRITLSKPEIDDYWVGNPNGFLFEAGKAATKYVYNVDPDLTREGGSIPVTIHFAKATGKDVILVPMGAGDDGAHAQNEKINKRNFIEGIKLLGTFLMELK